MASPGQLTYTTAIVAAFAGMLGDQNPNSVETAVSTEASLSTPFGVFTVYDSSGAAGVQSAKMPSASSGQKFRGVVLHSHTYDRTWTDADGVVHGHVDGVGLVPKSVMDVLVKGRVWVNCETACDYGDPVFVRYTTDGGSPALTQQGQVGNATGTGRTIDLTTKARFVTKASAPAAGATVLAMIEIDMTA